MKRKIGSSIFFNAELAMTVVDISHRPRMFWIEYNSIIRKMRHVFPCVFYQKVWQDFCDDMITCVNVE